MEIILGAIQLILIVIICVYEFKRKSVSIFLWAVLLIMFGIMHFLSCLSSNTEYSNEVMNKASIYVVIFCLSYLLLRKVTQKENNSECIEIKSDEEVKRFQKIFYNILIIMLVFVVVLQISSLATSAGGLSNTSWGNMRKATVGQEYFSYSQMFTTLFFVASSSLLIALSKKDRRKSIILTILIIVEVVVSRNRIEILPLFCAIITVYISKIDVLNLKRIFLLIGMTIIIIYSVYGLRVFRHYGTLENFANEFNFVEFNKTLGTYIRTDNGELGLRNHFYYFISNNNNFYGFNEGSTYKRMLLVLLPAKWSYGLKPSDFAITMGQAVDPTLIGYSVHPTLFGDCYANFGFIGCIFMGLFWAIYANILDYIIKIQKNHYFKYSLISICAVAYVIIGRGSVYNGFVWQFYGIIILYLINVLSRLRINKNEDNIGEKE